MRHLEPRRPRSDLTVSLEGPLLQGAFPYSLQRGGIPLPLLVAFGFALLLSAVPHAYRCARKRWVIHDPIINFANLMQWEQVIFIPKIIGWQSQRRMSVRQGLRPVMHEPGIISANLNPSFGEHVKSIETAETETAASQLYEPTFGRRMAFAIATFGMAPSLVRAEALRPNVMRSGDSKPFFLPDNYSTVIDVGGFLTPSETERIQETIRELERDTKLKLRIVAQKYPRTPGLAIEKYWAVDDNTVVMVADPGFGNLLNFNVGGNLDEIVGENFWKAVAARFGSKTYWQKNGVETSILASVNAINDCLRQGADGDENDGSVSGCDWLTTQMEMSENIPFIPYR